MTDTLLIDLDDTILDFHASEARAIRLTLTEMGVDATDEVVKLYSRINDEEWKKFERGETTREILVVHRFRRLYEALGVERDALATKKIYEIRLGDDPIFLSGAKDALAALAAQYDLYLVSNGTCIVQDRRVRDGDLERYFKGIFISERVGFNKPHRDFFDHVFGCIGEDRRATAAIVGDSLTSDILGGINAGIKTIWVNTRGNAPREGIVPDVTVACLKDVLEVLQG